MKDRYALTVVDLYEQKERAQDDQIEVAPTLIRQHPLPVRRLVGDLSQTDRVLAALELTPYLARMNPAVKTYEAIDGRGSRFAHSARRGQRHLARHSLR